VPARPTGHDTPPVSSRTCADRGSLATPAPVHWRRRLWHRFVQARLPFKAALVRAYLRTLEWRRSRTGATDDDADVEGLPVPPARLRVLVNGIPDLQWFLASGKAQTDYLHALLVDHGQPLEEMDAILEFGCGCGRMIRWWLPQAPATQVHGCDYNRELVRWCQENLPFASVTGNDLRPPLSYADASFDFVYAFSVFTHLSVELARSWLAELRRVTRPGGVIWFTIHSDSYRERLPAEQRRQFDAGQAVVWFPEIEGTNLCASYWPAAFVSELLGDEFEVLAHLDPQDDPVTAQGAQVAPHDAYLVRRL
jgi:SAM-dependent methyltransferase